MVLSLLLFY